MVLGIDIDDTLLDTLECASKIIMEKYPELKKYSTNELALIEEYQDIYKENIKIVFESENVKDNAIEVLNYFKNKGFKIIFITARGAHNHDYVIPITSLYFDKKNIYYDELILKCEYKGMIAKDKHVDLFIDDNESVLDEVKKYGIKTLRMSKDDVKSNHEVVHNWLEIKKYVDNMKEDI